MAWMPERTGVEGEPQVSDSEWKLPKQAFELRLSLD